MRFYTISKRIIDLSLCLVFFSIFIFPYFALMLVVKRQLGSPIFFRQTRPGLRGKPFEMIKFRSMVELRDDTGMPLPDADRMTEFGSWLRHSSLDELPELWNVLKGEMSLVGPRPLLTDYIPLYNERQSRRHDVRPGITGWAQVNGRNAVDWDEKLEMDVWYVENRSLWLDLVILGKTITTVFTRAGVSSSGHVTKEPFRGSQPTANTSQRAT